MKSGEGASPSIKACSGLPGRKLSLELIAQGVTTGLLVPAVLRLCTQETTVSGKYCRSVDLTGAFWP